MTNLRTLAVIAFTASILAALGGCANKQGDLGTDYQPTPEIRSHPDFVPAKADTIVYDNTAATSYLGKFFASNNEFGDEINLAGAARTITEFKFEAFANLSTTGDDVVRFRIYSNSSGVGAAPQTLLYDSNTADAPGGILLINGLNTITVGGLSLNVPGKITWTAEFNVNGVSGTGVADTAGLNLYSPATIGAVLAGGFDGPAREMVAPQMAGDAHRLMDAAGVLRLQMLHQLRDAPFAKRLQDEVYVVGHQAEGMHANAVATGEAIEAIEVGDELGAGLEDFL